MEQRGRVKKTLPWIAVVALVASLAIPAGAWAQVTWSSQRLAHKQLTNTWIDGPPAYAYTDEGGTDTLHATYMSDKVPPNLNFPSYGCNPSSGPFMSALYGKSTNDAVTWTDPILLSSPNAHAEGHGIATDGDTIVAYYRELNCYYAYGAAYRKTPSVIYTRTSLDGGDSFLPPVRITAPKKQVPDYPFLDAEYDGVATAGGGGPDLFVMSFTNGQNGLVKVAVSDDGGATWEKSNAGQTSLKVYPGYGGNSAVAVTGDDIGVAWMNTGGKVEAAFSDDAGDTWSSKITLSPGDARGPKGRYYSMGADAVDGRIGFTWTTGDEIRYREFGTGVTAKGGGGATLVQSFPDGQDPEHMAGTNPAVALHDEGVVGLAFAGCWTANCASSQRIDLQYTESYNNGDSFEEPVVVTQGVPGQNQKNQWPSIFWETSGERWIAYANWQGAYVSYRVAIKEGTGWID